MVLRDNRTDADGRTLLTSTLARPGTLLVGDDRRTLHGVSSPP